MAKKYPFGKSLLLIALITIFLNIPAIIWDNNHNWQNTKAFVKAVIEETIFTKDFSNYFLADLKCYAQGNTYVVSSLNQTSSCEIFRKQEKDTPLFYLGNLSFTLLLFIGGLALFFLNFKKEKDLDKKNFLRIFIFYFVLSIIIFLPMAYKFVKRYFIVAFFSAYIFLGLWMKFLVEKLKIAGAIVVSLIFAALFGSNYLLVKRTFITNPNQFKEENEYCGINLIISDEISKHIVRMLKKNQTEKFYLSTPLYMRGYRCVIQYFVEKESDAKITPVTKSERNLLEKNAILFFVRETNYSDATLNPDDYLLLDEMHGGNYDILMLKKI